MLRRARRQADPGRVQVGPLPAAAGADPRARARASAGCSPTRCPRRCGSRGEGLEDLVVGYPTADRTAIAELGAADRRAARHGAGADGRQPEHLDLIEDAAGGGQRADPRGDRARRRLLAARRAAEDRAQALADPHAAPGGRRSRARSRRAPRLRLVGLMAYEGHIAGLGDRPPGKRLQGRVIEWLQRARRARSARRRAAVVAAVSELADLEFVNGGGTGSLHGTTGEDAVTELAAGLGLLRPHAVRRLQLVPAAARGDVRDAGRAQARALDRDRARRRLPRLGARRAQPRPLPLPARRPAASTASRAPARCRRPCSARPRGTCASATASTSGTPRRASCASASRRSTSCPATGSWTRCPTYRGEGKTFL